MSNFKPIQPDVSGTELTHLRAILVNTQMKVKNDDKILYIVDNKFAKNHATQDVQATLGALLVPSYSVVV